MTSFCCVYIFLIMTDIYKVPKKEKDVIVQLDGKAGTPEKYTVFLNCISRYGNTEETVDEFLKESVDFFGVRAVEDGRFSIINYEAIVYVMETEAFDHEARDSYKLVLAGGEEIDVLDYTQRPSQYSRILDYLNSGEKFLSFICDNRRIYVNRAKILRVEVK